MDGDGLLEIGRDVTLEAVTEAELAAEEEYEERCRARQQAEDDWVDAVVQDQERRAEAKRRAAAAGAAAPSLADDEGGAGQHESHPWTSALARLGLSMQWTGKEGRGVATRRAFRAGEVMLRAAPAGAVLAPSCVSTHCHHCMRAASQLKRCSACGYARYCCAAHQRDAWPRHKVECAALRMTKPRVPGATVLLLIRLLTALELQRQQPHEAQPPDGSVALVDAITSLHVHLDDLPGDRAAELLHQARATCSLLAEAAPKLAGEGSSASPYVQPDFAARLLAALSTNAHTLCDEELQPVGIGLYPLAALTNHACEPSAVQVFDGPDLVLRALRLLKEGEAVTISYVDVAQSPAARRAELSAGYYFACACPRCEREAAPATEAALSGAGSELAQARSRVLAAIDESRWGDALADARVCCRLCDQLLPGGMPSAGIEKLRLAKLLSHQGHLGEALHAWKAARAILSITHGEDAPLVRAITSDVNAAAAEIDFNALQVN